jgi:hypothetical protein
MGIAALKTSRLRFVVTRAQRGKPMTDNIAPIRKDSRFRSRGQPGRGRDVVFDLRSRS